MIIEIIFGSLMFSALLTIAYSVRQMNNVASNAYSFIKSEGIEEKIQADSLDRTLKKIEKIVPPTVKEPPRDPSKHDFITELIRNGPRKDSEGNEWEIT